MGHVRGVVLVGDSVSTGVISCLFSVRSPIPTLPPMSRSIRCVWISSLWWAFDWSSECVVWLVARLIECVIECEYDYALTLIVWCV
jgi:hypothetical protein